MPRALTRLRYRTPPAPITFTRAVDRPRFDADLEKRVAAYVVRQSNPRHVKLQIVVNPKSRQQATGQKVIPPLKPFTLKDVVDPEGKSRHGEIIYVFRNTRTNQIIYSLGELLDVGLINLPRISIANCVQNHHLEQLPFIGKHSKPPVLRPDEWTPHCVITFPSPAQGQNAYRKLREFRKLHEMSWDKTNPEWKHAPIKERIKKIMNQRANMSADLAAVLTIQEGHGAKMAEALEEQQQKATEFLDKRWAEIDALANAAVAKEKEADNVKWLEHQIRSLTMKLNMKHNQNEADQKRLKSARLIQEIRLRKIQYAQRKAEQFKNIQADLAQRAAPANELGADGKLEELRDQAQVLEESLANPDPTRSEEDLAVDRQLLASHKSEIKTLEEAFDAKTLVESRDHHIARSVLPAHFKKTLPTPYSLEGISVQWADMQDAMYAAGQWPELIEHETLPLNSVRSQVAYLSPEDYELESHGEVSNILQSLQAQRDEVAPAAA